MVNVLMDGCVSLQCLCIWRRCGLWWGLSMHDRISWSIWQKSGIQYPSLWTGIPDSILGHSSYIISTFVIVVHTPTHWVKSGVSLFFYTLILDSSVLCIFDRFVLSFLYHCMQGIVGFAIGLAAMVCLRNLSLKCTCWEVILSIAPQGPLIWCT